MDLSRLGRHTPVAVTNASREAGVLAPVITRDGDAYLLFTKRAEHLGEHPGQMSFPGGGREPVDETLRETALRETYEEIGVPRTDVTIVGHIDDIRTSTEYAVRPFVGLVPDGEFTPDESEVAEIVLLPVAGLTDLANYESELRDHPDYGRHRIHYFRVDGYTVWGATGRMVVQLLELTTDWEMPVAVDRVVGPDADLSV